MYISVEMGLLYFRKISFYPRNTRAIFGVCIMFKNKKEQRKPNQK